jgi:hypothetical protein
VIEVPVSEEAYAALLSLLHDSIIVPPKRTADGVIA